jgi:hypothetical protein
VPVHSAWFNSELVVYSDSESLLTADVAFRSLHRDMPEKELDLFKFSAGGMAKPRTRSAKVVRSELRDFHARCDFLNNMPNRLLRNTLPP